MLSEADRAQVLARVTRVIRAYQDDPAGCARELEARGLIAAEDTMPGSPYARELARRTEDIADLRRRLSATDASWSALAAQRDGLLDELATAREVLTIARVAALRITGRRRRDWGDAEALAATVEELTRDTPLGDPG